MTFNGSGYVAMIDAKPIGFQMNLRVFSCDTRDNWVVSGWSSYTVQASDVIAPEITDVEWLPLDPYANETIHVNTSVSDVNQIELVLLSYFDGVYWRNLTMVQMSSDRFVCQIPAIGTAGIIQIWILAQDAKGNWGYTDYMDIEIRPEPEPSIPTVPTTTPTTPSTTPTGAGPPDATLFLVFGGAGWAIAVILIVFVLVRKKK